MSRAKVEKYLYNVLDSLTGTKDNSDIYKDKLSKMNNKVFDKWINDVNDGKIGLAIFLPNGTKSRINKEKAYAIAKDIGFSFFQRLVIPAKDGVPEHLSNVPVMVLDVMARRASQILTKKMAVEYDDKKVNLSTGQATGTSSPSGISYPELVQMDGLGLTNTIEEFEKVRGGDSGAYNAYVGELENRGEARLSTARTLSTGTGSKATLGAYLAGKMLSSNI